MATKVSEFHCSKCGELLNRIVAGNIVDFTHDGGTYKCREQDQDTCLAY